MVHGAGSEADRVPHQVGELLLPPDTGRGEHVVGPPGERAGQQTTAALRLLLDGLGHAGADALALAGRAPGRRLRPAGLVGQRAPGAAATPATAEPPPGR